MPIISSHSFGVILLTLWLWCNLCIQQLYEEKVSFRQKREEEKERCQFGGISVDYKGVPIENLKVLERYN